MVSRPRFMLSIVGIGTKVKHNRSGRAIFLTAEVAESDENIVS